MSQAKGQKTVAKVETITTPGKDSKNVAVPIPLPCITILVHGVNDIGEAYAAQEQGLCAGLNERLNRSHSLQADGLAGSGDLRAANYRLPDKKRRDPLVENPDTWFYQRLPDANSYSPVIPFYWGYIEEQDEILRDHWHGEWTDRYGNRLDHNPRNGD